MGFLKQDLSNKWIPNMYREYELLLLKKWTNNINGNVKLYEFQKDGWTFHAKGCWVYENGSKYPNLTVIGSSNYSYRSNRRDTEAQLYMYSECDKFNKKLKEEADMLFSHANQVTLKDIKKSKEARLGFRTRFLSKRLKSLF